MPSNMNNKLDPMFSSSSRRDFTGNNSINGKGLCGGFDAPIHHRTDHDRASLLDDYNRKTSVVSSAGGSFISDTASSSPSPSSSKTSSESSDFDFPGASHHEISSLCSDDDYQEVVKKILQHERPMRITIKLHITESKYTKWESVLNPLNNILYVVLPSHLQPEASKQSFISLLEFAEDKLDVDGVVLCIRKDQNDRALLVQTFMMLGFQPLSKKSPLAPPADNGNENHFFLIYNMEE